MKAKHVIPIAVIVVIIVVCTYLNLTTDFLTRGKMSEKDTDYAAVQKNIVEWYKKEKLDSLIGEIKFESDSQIWITLPDPWAALPDSYKTHGVKAESVFKKTYWETFDAGAYKLGEHARTLARGYKEDSGYPHRVTVTIWSHDHTRHWESHWP